MRVYHIAHGLGRIIQIHSENLSNNVNLALEIAKTSNKKAAILAPLILAGMYSPSRYPYRVRFDSGYTDVYSQSDLCYVVSPEMEKIFARKHVAFLVRRERWQKKIWKKSWMCSRQNKLSTEIEFR